MFKRLKDWWNREDIEKARRASDLARKLEKRLKEINRGKAAKDLKRAQESAESERKRLLQFSQRELEAFKLQASLTGRPILLDLILVLERRIKDSKFAHKTETYRLKLEQLLDLIGRE